MSNLITIVGNSGVGKTTFTQQLCQQADFVTGLEQHVERPFQKLFSLDLHQYALPNQIDYLLFRAEQELAIRKSDAIGVLDGGLDQDFFVFTRHFYRKGYLTEGEFKLCERFYLLWREILPPPDLIVRLAAPIEVIARRHARRNRSLEIARLEDLAALEALLEEWLGNVPATSLLTVDACQDDPGYGEGVNQVMAWMRSL